MEILNNFYRLLAILVLPAGLLVGGFYDLGGFAHPVEVGRLIQMSFPDLSMGIFSGLIGGGVGMLVMFMANPFSGSSGRYGNAHFASGREIKKMGLRQDTGIILGESKGDYLRSDQPLSTLLLAPPGTGKTAGFVIPNLFSCGNSMLTFDVKGELYRITSKRRAEFSKVYKFEPASPISAKWNPLSADVLPDDWAEKMVTIDRIAAILYPINPEKRDHWTQEGKSMFVFFALFLVWRDGGSSIPAIRSFGLSSDDSQEMIRELIEDNPDMPSRIIEEGNGIVSKPEKEYGSVFSTFKSYLNVFADPYVSSALDGNDFRFADFRKERTSVYLVVKAHDVGRLAPVMTLLFESCANYILSHEPEKTDHIITFMIDEFARLGKMQQVLDMPALARGNRGHAQLIAQDYAQIKRLYGQEGPEILDGTCAHFIIYPQNNKDTAQNFSDKIGDKTITKKSTSKSSKDLLNKSTSISEERLPLVSRQELLSMKPWTSLVLVQNNFKRPIQAKPVRWFADRQMKKMAGCVDADFRADPDVEEKLKDSGVLGDAATSTSQVVPPLEQRLEESGAGEPDVIDLDESPSAEIVEDEPITDITADLDNDEQSESDDENETAEKKPSTVDLFG